MGKDGQCSGQKKRLVEEASCYGVERFAYRIFNPSDYDLRL